MIPFALQFYLTVQLIALHNRLIMESLGYRWWPPLPGAILFVEGEWRKG